MSKNNESHNVTVERKCRLCNNIRVDEHFVENYTELFELLENLYDEISKPGQLYCEKCRKTTVHEMISYH